MFRISNKRTQQQFQCQHKVASGCENYCLYPLDGTCEVLWQEQGRPLELRQWFSEIQTGNQEKQGRLTNRVMPTISCRVVVMRHDGGEIRESGGSCLAWELVMSDKYGIWGCYTENSIVHATDHWPLLKSHHKRCKYKDALRGVADSAYQGR